MLSGKWYFEGRKVLQVVVILLSNNFENHINDSVGWGSDQLGFGFQTDGQKQNST